MVIRVPYAGGIGGVEHHCDSSEAYYAHTPGLHVRRPGERRRRVHAAARGDRLRRPGRVPGAQEALLGQGGGRPRRPGRPASAGPLVVRDGTDATLIAYGPSVPVAAGGRRGRRPGGPQPAGRRPALDRAVRRRDRVRGGPLDRPRRRGRRGAPASPSVSSEIVARVTERCFHSLAAPIRAGHRLRHPLSAAEAGALPPARRGPGPRRRRRPAVGRSDEQTAATFLLPDLGEGLTEAEIVRWLVAEGDRSSVDQAVVEVETAKSLVEVPSPFAGTGRRPCTAATASAVAVGRAADHGRAPTRRPASARPRPTARRSRPAPATCSSATAPPVTGEPRPDAPSTARAASPPRRRPRLATPARRACRCVVSPLVRSLARDGGVDLTDVDGTGPATGRDHPRSTWSGTRGAPGPTPPPRRVDPGAERGERRTPLNGFRKAVSAALTRSRAEIPEATVWVDVDATALWELRESSTNADRPGRGCMAYIARFVVAGLQRVPGAQLPARHRARRRSSSSTRSTSASPCRASAASSSPP